MRRHAMKEHSCHPMLMEARAPHHIMRFPLATRSHDHERTPRQRLPRGIMHSCSTMPPRTSLPTSSFEEYRVLMQRHFQHSRELIPTRLLSNVLARSSTLLLHAITTHYINSRPTVLRVKQPRDSHPHDGWKAVSHQDIFKPSPTRGNMNHETHALTPPCPLPWNGVITLMPRCH